MLKALRRPVATICSSSIFIRQVVHNRQRNQLVDFGYERSELAQSFGEANGCLGEIMIDAEMVPMIARSNRTIYPTR